MRIVGGAVEALAHVTRFGGIAGNMAGGTHHSHRSFGSGYCVFNDLAICALQARDKYGYERIAILDLDVHQGDGTATILKDEEGIITISVHGEKIFPSERQLVIMTFHYRTVRGMRDIYVLLKNL